MPEEPQKKRCSHIKKDGTRCKRWARRGDTNCSSKGHGGGRPPTPGSLYSQYYTEEEQAIIPAIRAEMDVVESEIVSASIFLIRLQKLLTQQWEGDATAGQLTDTVSISEKTTEEIQGENGLTTKTRDHSRAQVSKKTPDLWMLAGQMLERIRRLKETKQSLKIGHLDELIAQYEKVIDERKEEEADQGEASAIL